MAAAASLLRGDLLHHHQGGKQVADLVGVLWVPRGVLARAAVAPRAGTARQILPPVARPFPAWAKCVSMKFRPAMPRNAAAASAANNPGNWLNSSLRRFKARRYRLLVVDSFISSVSATSALVNCSKCRSARISRSIGSMPLSTSCTRSRVSALTAACDGEVSRPSNWAASEPSWPPASARGAGRSPDRRHASSPRGGGDARRSSSRPVMCLSQRKNGNG